MTSKHRKSATSTFEHLPGFVWEQVTPYLTCEVKAWEKSERYYNMLFFMRAVCKQWKLDIEQYAPLEIEVLNYDITDNLVEFFKNFLNIKCIYFQLQLMEWSYSNSINRLLESFNDPQNCDIVIFCESMTEYRLNVLSATCVLTLLNRFKSTSFLVKCGSATDGMEEYQVLPSEYWKEVKVLANTTTLYLNNISEKTLISLDDTIDRLEEVYISPSQSMDARTTPYVQPPDSQCPQLGRSIINLIQVAQNLKQLEIHLPFDVPKLTGPTQLERLTIHGSYEQDRNLHVLTNFCQHCPNLRTIELQYFALFSGLPTCPKVEEVILQNNYALTGDTKHLLSSFPNLKSLNVDFEETMYEAREYEAAGWNLSSLESLRIGSCQLPSSIELMAEKLQQLDICFVNGLQELYCDWSSLRRLKVCFVRDFAVSSLESILLCANSLTHLVLVGCPKHTGSGAILKLVSSSLMDLRLKNVEGITDSTLSFAFQHCSNLRNVVLENITLEHPSLRSDTIESLKVHGTGLMDASFSEMQCPKLSTLSITNCPKIVHPRLTAGAPALRRVLIDDIQVQANIERELQKKHVCLQLDLDRASSLK